MATHTSASKRGTQPRIRLFFSGKGDSMTDRKPTKTKFPNPDKRQPAILIVEDEILLRVALAEYLRVCGFKIYEARTGEEAITLLRSGKIKVDLVFSDVEMPGAVDGFALAQWLKKNRPSTPILLSGIDSKKAEAAQSICAAEPFYTNPYDLKRVIVFVRNALKAQTRKG
jgi:DNA-binding NtrC family response regulator